MPYASPMMPYCALRMLHSWLVWNCAYGLTQRMAQVKRTLTMLKMRPERAAGCRLNASRYAARRQLVEALKHIC